MKELVIVIDGQPWTVKVDGSPVVFQLWNDGCVVHTITVKT